MSVVFRDCSNELSTSFEGCLAFSSARAVATLSPPPSLLSTSRGEAVSFGTFFVPRLNFTTGRTSAVSELISVMER